MENLLFFSRHLTRQDMKDREEETYHHQITHMQQTLSLFHEGQRNQWDWSKSALRKETSQKVLKDTLFFECGLLEAESSESKHRALSREFKESHLSLRGKLHKVTKHVKQVSLHPLWGQNWSLQEENFSVFLERCCEFLSTQGFFKTPILPREKRPYFQDRIPPAGYYLETFERGHTFWRPFSLQELSLIHI